MLICKSCNSIVKDIDYNALKYFNSLMKANKDFILDNFFDSPRIKIILASLNMNEASLRTTYASSIYDFFYSFTTEEPQFSYCPTVSTFFNEIIEYEDCGQVILLMYTQFKNSLLSILFDEKKAIAFTPALKLKIFNNFSIILDFNLAIVIQEYNNLLLQKERDIFEHSRLIEEQTIASKTDVNGRITFVSDSFAELCGYTKEELIGQKHSILKHKDFNNRIYEKMWQRITMGMIWKGKLKNIRKDGKEVIFQTTIIPEYNNENHIIGYIALRNDITDKVKGQKDALTGLINRASFNDSFINAVEEYSISNKNFSLVFMDIDHFKQVNDVYGHIIGDHVLQHFSKIVEQNIRDIDIFARWGGEEFILILSGIDFKTALSTTERIRSSVENAYFDEVECITASFGVMEYDHKYVNQDAFLADVEKCLYHSKETGRNKITYKENNEFKVYGENIPDYVFLDEEQEEYLLRLDSEFNSHTVTILDEMSY